MVSQSSAFPAATWSDDHNKELAPMSIKVALLCARFSSYHSSLWKTAFTSVSSASSHYLVPSPISAQNSNDKTPTPKTPIQKMLSTTQNPFIHWRFICGIQTGYRLHRTHILRGLLTAAYMMYLRGDRTVPVMWTLDLYCNGVSTLT